MFEVINENLTEAGFVIEPTALPWNPDYLDAVSAGRQARPPPARLDR